MTDGPLGQAAAAYYEELGWAASPVEGRDGFSFDIAGTDASWTALLLVDEALRRLVFWSFSPVDIAPERLAATGEFLHRATHGLTMSAFELDVDAGEVSLRTALELLDVPALIYADPTFLRWAVAEVSEANIGVFDRYLPGLVAMSLGADDPAAVIADLGG